MIRSRPAVVCALALSVALGVGAWQWRTNAVGGSDSSCYALMARAFAAGEAQPASALALEAPWPDPTRVAAPGGFLPSATRPGAAAPICAPGYSLLIAPFVRIGGLQAVHVVPALAGAAVVWIAFVAARRLAGPWSGVAAAALVASHPIVQFQAVQPMNDITTAALWSGAATAAIAGRAGAAGVLLALGLLVRPNLALGAIAIAAVAMWRASAPIDLPAWKRRALGAGVVIAAWAVPVVITVLLLNAVLYGSPWRSGYGDLESLFAWRFATQNLGTYGATWMRTSTPLGLVALAAPWLVPRDRRREAAGLLAIAAALAVVYLLYLPFPEWWYLRYLLPSVVIALVLMAAAITAMAARLSRPWSAIVPVFAVVAVAVHAWHRPEALDARALWRNEARFPLTADVVARRLPTSAVLVTGWQSGAIRYGPGQEILMWDALDPQWLDRAIDWLESRGRAPAIVLETWEEAGFRERFTSQVYGALDWAPRFDIDRRVHVFVPADRAAFLRGERTGPAESFRPPGVR